MFLLIFLFSQVCAHECEVHRHVSLESSSYPTLNYSQTCIGQKGCVRLQTGLLDNLTLQWDLKCGSTKSRFELRQVSVVNTTCESGRFLVWKIADEFDLLLHMDGGCSEKLSIKKNVKIKHSCLQEENTQKETECSSYFGMEQEQFPLSAVVAGLIFVVILMHVI